MSAAESGTLETDALVKELAQAAGNLPIVALDLREGRIEPQRQHELASLIIQLGEQLHRHADLHTEPTELQRQRQRQRGLLHVPDRESLNTAMNPRPRSR